MLFGRGEFYLNRGDRLAIQPDRMNGEFIAAFIENTTRFTA